MAQTPAKKSATKKRAGKPSPKTKTKTPPAKTSAKTSAKKTPAKKDTSRAPSQQPTASTPHKKDDGDAGIRMRASTRHFPVSAFGATLGLAGFAMLWREAGDTMIVETGLPTPLFGLSAGFYIAVLILYVLKCVRHPDALVEDFTNPVTANFFAAASMTMILLAAGMAPHAPGLAEGMWAIGTIAQIGVSALIVNQWMSRDCHVTSATPTWFLPIAGNMLIPIVGTPMGYEQIGWMTLGVGILFWMVVQTVVFYRLLFKAPMEHPQRPTIAIIIAPPSLAFTAYLVLNEGILGGPAYMFFGLAIFMTFITLPQVPALMRIPFGLSWWSYIFPLSAFGVAAFLLSDASGNPVLEAVAILVLAVLSLLVAIVSALTVRALIRGELFRLPRQSQDRILNLQPDESL